MQKLTKKVPATVFCLRSTLSKVHQPVLHLYLQMTIITKEMNHSASSFSWMHVGFLCMLGKIYSFKLTISCTIKQWSFPNSSSMQLRC